MAIAQMHALTAGGEWVPWPADQGAGTTNSVRWSYAAASGGIVDTSDVTLVAAAGVGMANYLTALQFHNKDASVGTEIVIKDGSTVIWRAYAPANMVSAVGVSFPTPLSSSSNAALNAAAITTSAELYVNAQGYQDQTYAFASAGRTQGEEIFDDTGAILYSDTNAQLYM